MRRHPA